MNTLIDRIQLAIESDTFQRQKYSRELTQYYDEATKVEKVRIDLCFVAMCGMSLAALIASERQARQATL